RLNPAAFGVPVTVHFDGASFGAGTVRLTVLETVSGDAAWQMVQDANQFNAPPIVGHEYVLALFRVEVLALDDPDQPIEMSPVHFDAFSAAGVQYEDVFVQVCCLEPDIRRDTYGGSYDGWVAFQVAPGDDARAVFD